MTSSAANLMHEVITPRGNDQGAPDETRWGQACRCLVRTASYLRTPHAPMRLLDSRVDGGAIPVRFAQRPICGIRQYTPGAGRRPART